MAKAKLTPKKSSGVVVNRQASIAESRKVKNKPRGGKKPKFGSKKPKAGGGGGG